MRRDARVDEPTEEFAGAVRGIGRKPAGLQSQRLFGTLDHQLGRGHFVVGTRRRRLHVDDDRVLDVDHVIEPVAEQDTLVGFRRPGRARVHRRDHLGWFAIAVGIFVIEGSKEFGDRPGLTFRHRPVDLVRSLAMIAAGVGFHDACVDRKGFTFDQTGIHARPHHRLEYLAEQIAVAEPTVAIDREGRVIGNLVVRSRRQNQR
jgi:hypothetical protein